MAKNEIYLYGSVGMSWWGEDYFPAQMVREQLAGMTGPITVRINSGGGVVADGLAIYTMLVDYPDTVNVVIDGMAASSASLIAMAGTTITMRLGSSMMIHDAARDWVDGRGTEQDHLDEARRLSVLSNAVADVYAKRAGITREEARALMKAETFMDGPAAVAAGFATHYDDSIKAATAATFDYRIYAHAPAALLGSAQKLGKEVPKEAVLAMMAGNPRPTTQPKKGNTMSQDTATIAAVAGQPTATPHPTAAQAAPPAQAAPAAPSQPTMAAAPPTPDALRTERERTAAIMQSVQMAGLGMDIAQDLIARGVPTTAALAEITAKWQAKGDIDIPSHGATRAVVTADARDKFIMGAAKGLMMRAGINGGERNEFTGLTLSEMAKECLNQSGQRITMMGRREYVGAAFTMSGGMHGTSDFVNILAAVANKAMLVGYETADETFDIFTRKINLPDFKRMNMVGLDMLPALREVKPGAEYKHVTMGERAESIAVVTYGELFAITREAIINDDTSAFTRLPQMFGRMARVTVGDLVYAILTGTPTMSDGKTLFHADHDNLAGTGSALTLASVSAGRAAIRRQQSGKKGDANRRTLNLNAQYLIVPATLEMVANQLIRSAVDPTENKGMAINPIQNSLTVIVDPRLDNVSTTAWYLAASPNAVDTIGVGYLDGVETPYLEEQPGFSTDGVTYKVRIDAGASALGWNGLWKNPGA